MKVLTIREPWASLIGAHIKLIETRSWPTKYRGELYIHAGLAPLPKKDVRIKLLDNSIINDLHFGTIFLKCNLSNCIQITKEFATKVKQESPQNYLWGDYTEGRYAWILTDVQYIEPIKAKGHLSIWNYTPEKAE